MLKKKLSNNLIPRYDSYAIHFLLTKHFSSLLCIFLFILDYLLHIQSTYVYVFTKRLLVRRFNHVVSVLFSPADPVASTMVAIFPLTEAVGFTATPRNTSRSSSSWAHVNKFLPLFHPLPPSESTANMLKNRPSTIISINSISEATTRATTGAAASSPRPRAATATCCAQKSAKHFLGSC